MQIRSLGWEDLLEKEMTTHSSIFAWEIPWTEEPEGIQSGCGVQVPVPPFQAMRTLGSYVDGWLDDG